jgi:hypothetical protein
MLDDRKALTRAQRSCRSWRLRIALVAFLALPLVSQTWPELALSAQSPSFEPIHSPDRFAWKLFLDINRPALAGKRGEADPAKKIGDPGKTVWETWKLARTEVFLPNGEKPQGWDAAEPLAPTPKQRFEPPKREILRRMALGLPDPGEGSAPLLDPDPRELTNETRMNKETFEFVVNNKLYFVEGQEKVLADGTIMDFPKEAREIKGAWKILGASGAVPKATLDRYHTAEVGGTVYGLVGLHIITKDLPNWFWATFEHVDNPPPEFADIDRSGYPARFPGSDNPMPLPPELKGTKWENYRLRGTQVDFTDPRGAITLLANTQIEGGFQMSSSCITCHALATIGEPMKVPPGTFVPPAGIVSKNSHRLSIFATLIPVPRDPMSPARNDPALIFGMVGRPDSMHFFKGGTGQRRYAQLDFLWSLRRAQRKAPM